MVTWMELQKGYITKLHIDVIVNAANILFFGAATSMLLFI
jgi:O-acetyl-ADP-ribose deacetylase (regulator of RNase III)